MTILNEHFSPLEAAMDDWDIPAKGVGVGVGRGRGAAKPAAADDWGTPGPVAAKSAPAPAADEWGAPPATSAGRGGNLPSQMANMSIADNSWGGAPNAKTASESFPCFVLMMQPTNLLFSSLLFRCCVGSQSCPDSQCGCLE